MPFLRAMPEEVSADGGDTADSTTLNQFMRGSEGGTHEGIRATGQFQPRGTCQFQQCQPVLTRERERLLAVNMLACLKRARADAGVSSLHGQVDDDSDLGVPKQPFRTPPRDSVRYRVDFGMVLVKVGQCVISYIT